MSVYTQYLKTYTHGKVISNPGNLDERAAQAMAMHDVRACNSVKTEDVVVHAVKYLIGDTKDPKPPKKRRKKKSR